MGFAASLPFIAIYFRSEFGMSMTEIGVFFGVLAVVRSVFQAVGGEAADRVERKWLLIYAQYFRAACFVMMGLSVHFGWGLWPTALSLLVNSIFGALFQPAANAMVADLLPEERRLDGYAITRSAGNLGWAAGPALGGFIAMSSFSALFFLSAIITFCSGLVFHLFLKPPSISKIKDRFHFADLISVRHDRTMAIHVFLIFILYLVVAQLMVPFSVYAVDWLQMTKTNLGYLYSLNGLLVVALQLPMTRLLAKKSLTAQLSLGALLYFIGYGLIGWYSGYGFLMMAFTIVTIGEVMMSPPSLTLSSRLAPKGRMGRYMGIHGFFVASGWSLGPLYGGIILDQFGSHPEIAWLMIASITLISSFGYLLLRKRVSEKVNLPDFINGK